jgi:ubiquinone/menaquinone biosynthesis C-methylase UbiE
MTASSSSPSVSAAASASAAASVSAAASASASAAASVSPVYDTIGRAYVAHRRADPRWEAALHAQLGDARARFVVNVGAGTGSYEPVDRSVVAIEPSRVMVEQRPAGAAPAVRASASALPLPSGCADVALAILTVHHWDDWSAGLAELCRVAPRRVVLAIDFELHARFWLLDEYVPEVAETTRGLSPRIDEVAAAIGASSVTPMLVPRDMEDGVLGAYWCRPEAYLDPAVRANCSGLALADPAVMARGVAGLEADLSSGAWWRRHADLADLPALDIGYRLVVADGREDD